MTGTLLLLFVSCGLGEPSSATVEMEAEAPTDSETETETQEEDPVFDPLSDESSVAVPVTDTGSVVEKEEDLPEKYVYEDDSDEDAGPLLSLKDLEGALAEAMSSSMDFDPDLVFEAYTDAVSRGDDECPYYYDEYYENYGYDYWYGPCEAEDGSEYSSGYIYGVDYGDYWSGDYHYLGYAWQYGDLGMAFADGQSFDMSGYFYRYHYQYDPTRQTYFSISMVGEAYWQGEDYADTWLANNLSIDIAYSGGWHPHYGTYLSLSGGLSGFEGTANSVYFDDVYLASEGQGSDCSTEPGGMIAIRDSDGEWYEVEFHGPAYSGASYFDVDCDGCGEVWYRGDSMGMVCPDFGRLGDWEEQPW